MLPFYIEDVIIFITNGEYMTCGIYRLKFNGTDKVYIGKSQNIEYRFTQHIYKLNKNTSSKKLQEAFKIYGLPILEILTECSEEKLNEYEKETIEIFDSVNNGLNTYSENRGTAPATRARGEDSATSIYGNDLIYLVFEYLIDQPMLTASQVSEETGVNVHTVRAVSALNEHIWLKDKYPEQYKILEGLKGLTAKASKYSSAALGKVYPSLISPEGDVFPSIPNVKEFCRVHGLQDTNLRLVLNGHRKTHKGWRLCPKELVS